MQPRFDHPKHLGFQLAASLHADYRGLLLPGAEVISAQGESGLIVLQDIVHPEFQLRLQSYDLLKPLRIPARQEKAFLVALLSLKNSIHYFIKGLGPFQLRQGQFALLHTQEKDAMTRFEKSGTYQSLEVVWSEALVERVLPHFTLLNSLFKENEKNNSFCVTEPGQAAGTHALGIVQALLKSPYNDAVSLLYFKHKVQEYLLSILAAAEKNPRLKIPLTNEEYEKVLSLAEKLASRIDQHFPIAVLAKEAQMNEMKLKLVFKELFGKGIFEYHLEARMREAHRLLEETDLTTKAIASMVGYELGTSFIAKFREYFGYPPSEVGKGRR